MLKILQHIRWIVVGFAAVVLLHGVIKNIAAEEWEVISQLPTGRSAFSTAVVDGKIYLIGGFLRENMNGGPLGISTVEVYDTKNNRWQRLTRYANASIILRGSRRGWKNLCHWWL